MSGLLLISQTFPPEAAAVGQHFWDVAHELARRGRRVVVLTSANGYEDPTIQYPLRETTAAGVEIRRIRFASLGKSNLPKRMIASLAFMIQCFILSLLIPDIDCIFFSTAPPFIGFVAAVAGLLRRIPVAFWAMDLNPDQLVALGKLSPNGLRTRALHTANRFILRRSVLVIALDRLMANRLERYGAHRRDIVIIPPWSPEDATVEIARASNPFRIKHQLGDATVVMYSGNHTPSNPLATLLRAAVVLRDEHAVRFVFVGGGVGKREVESYVRDHGLMNVLSLPYQPRETLSSSLGAADVHVVSLGDNMAGIIHPSKIYGAMAVARPILFFGPSPSHVSDILNESAIGWQVGHGDVDSAVRVIRQIIDLSAADREAMGNTARDTLLREFGPDQLCSAVCDAVERHLIGHV